MLQFTVNSTLHVANSKSNSIQISDPVIRKASRLYTMSQFIFMLYLAGTECQRCASV
jgi:hypothetical protein